VALRLVQVGIGGWGLDWTANIVTKSPDWELVGAVDVNPAALARIQRYGLRADQCFTTFEEALDQVDFDAVLVTAFLAGHVPVALAALKAGKHVLVEKPFAPSVDEARTVVATADAAQRIIMVSQNYRFYPAPRAVSALVREGELGPVSAVNIDFRRYANSAAPEGHRHYALQQPLLMDMSIHHFDLMRAVLGSEPIVVDCVTWNPPWSNFREPPAGAATIRFHNDAVVSYRGSWISTGPQTPWAGEWRIECERGEITWTSRANWGVGAERVTVKPLGKRARRVELPSLEHIDRAGTLHAFAQAIRSGEEPETSGRDNIGSLALMHAAIDAATRTESIYLP
jgi:predicted dehydrogenase